MSATRVYWGCTTLAGCDFGFGGTECAMPSDWEFCPSCGGELHEITSSLGSGATGAQPLGGDHGHGTCRPSCSTDAPQSQARGGASIPGEAPAATGGGEPSCAAPAHASLTPFGVSTTETAKPSNQELAKYVERAKDALKLVEERPVGMRASSGVWLRGQVFALAQDALALVARVEALLLAERDARITEDEYRERSQKWVDSVCHYRNLAIALGAAPNQMLTRYDRELAEKHDPSDTEGWQEGDQPELWEEAEALEGRVAVLKATLRDECEMNEQSLATLRDLLAHWERLGEERTPDGEPVIEEELRGLIDDLDTSSARAVLAGGDAAPKMRCARCGEVTTAEWRESGWAASHRCCGDAACGALMDSSIRCVLLKGHDGGHAGGPVGDAAAEEKPQRKENA